MLKKEDVNDENGQNRHQHLKVVANHFRLQRPSTTSSVNNIDVDFRVYSCYQFYNRRSDLRRFLIRRNNIPDIIHFYAEANNMVILYGP